MKKLFSILSGALILSMGSLAFAQAHEHQHPKHNMVVFGDSPIFMSHVVYKSPHNYQVILQVQLPDEVAKLYRAEKAAHPQDTVYFLLDSVDISQIAVQKPALKGNLFREDLAGNDSQLAQQVPVLDYQILYFDEVPTQL